MNADGLLAAALALCCVAGVGMASSSLDDAVTTDPDDVIDLDYSELPIGQEDAQRVKERIQGTETTVEPDAEVSGEMTAPSEGSNDAAGAGGDAGDTPATTVTQRAVQRGLAPTETQAAGPAPVKRQNFFEWVLSLLSWLVSLLVRLVPLAALVAALALAYASRDRLLDWLGVDVAGSGAADAADDPDRSLDPDPQDEVERAWYEMVTALDVDERWSKTPREYAEEAVARGRDADAVSRVTEVFEEVRYGGQPVTDERERRARDGLERLQTEEDA